MNENVKFEKYIKLQNYFEVKAIETLNTINDLFPIKGHEYLDPVEIGSRFVSFSGEDYEGDNFNFSFPSELLYLDGALTDYLVKRREQKECEEREKLEKAKLAIERNRLKRLAEYESLKREFEG